MRRLLLPALVLLALGSAVHAEPLPPFPANGIPRTHPFSGWATGATVQRGPQDIVNPGGPFASVGVPGNATGAANGSVVSLGDGGSATLTFAGLIYNGPGADFVVFENAFFFNGGVFGELGFVEVSSDGSNFVRFPSISLTQTATQVTNANFTDPTKIHNLAGQFPNNSFGGRFEGTPFDLEDLAGSAGLNINAITHVRIEDVVGRIAPDAGSGYLPRTDSQGNIINDPYSTDFASSGFDLDAVGAIHMVPLPGSLVLLLTGVGGLGLRRLVRKRLPLLTALLIALAVVGSVAADDAVKKDFEKLQGVWVVTAAEQDGKALDRLQGGKLTVKDQNFHVKTASGTEMKGDLTLDPAKKPKHIDWFHQEGLLREKTWQGIYELEGDDLKICYAEADSGKDRPDEFKTEADSKRLLVILKREKK
jgi:uncharacterized protein (TIGR03067 family)